MRWNGLALGAFAASFAPIVALFISETKDYAWQVALFVAVIVAHLCAQQMFDAHLPLLARSTRGQSRRGVGTPGHEDGQRCVEPRRRPTGASNRTDSTRRRAETAGEGGRGGGGGGGSDMQFQARQGLRASWYPSPRRWGSSLTLVVHADGTVQLQQGGRRMICPGRLGIRTTWGGLGIASSPPVVGVSVVLGAQGPADQTRAAAAVRERISFTWGPRCPSSAFEGR